MSIKFRLVLTSLRGNKGYKLFKFVNLIRHFAPALEFGFKIKFAVKNNTANFGLVKNKIH